MVDDNKGLSLRTIYNEYATWLDKLLETVHTVRVLFVTVQMRNTYEKGITRRLRFLLTCLNVLIILFNKQCSQEQLWNHNANQYFSNNIKIHHKKESKLAVHISWKVNSQPLFYSQTFVFGTSNHMFSREIWDKFTEFIFENF